MTQRYQIIIPKGCVIESVTIRDTGHKILVEVSEHDHDDSDSTTLSTSSSDHQSDGEVRGKGSPPSPSRFFLEKRFRRE